MACLQLLVKGNNPQHIACHLSISEKMLEKHLKSLRNKTNANSTIQLIHITRDFFK